MTLPPFLTKYLSVFRAKKHDHTTNPTRDWLILLVLSLVALIASVIWNLWFFSEALSDKGSTAPTTTSNEDTSDSVERAKARFEARALEEGRYRSDYRFVDPSR
jgi:hypothetical protein